MNQNPEQTAPYQNRQLDAAISIVDQLIELRSSATEISGSGSLINKKSLLAWSANEWSSFFFDSIDLKQAAAQICDATVPIVGQHNTQLVLAGSAIAKAYQRINALPAGEKPTTSQLMELATPIAEHLTLSVVSAPLLLVSTGTRAVATHTPAATRNNIYSFFTNIPGSISTLATTVREYFGAAYQNNGIFGGTNNNNARVNEPANSQSDVLQDYGI